MRGAHSRSMKIRRFFFSRALLSLTALKLTRELLGKLIVSATITNAISKIEFDTEQIWYVIQIEFYTRPFLMKTFNGNFSVRLLMQSENRATLEISQDIHKIEMLSTLRTFIASISSIITPASQLCFLSRVLFFPPISFTYSLLFLFFLSFSSFFPDIRTGRRCDRQQVVTAFCGNGTCRVQQTSTGVPSRSGLTSDRHACHRGDLNHRGTLSAPLCKHSRFALCYYVGNKRIQSLPFLVLRDQGEDHGSSIL